MTSAVQDSMRMFESDDFGNPSSVHDFGIKARTAIEDARSIIGEVLNIGLEGLIFTGSGTESDNLAIQGLLLKHRNQKPHLITTIIEHPAVYNSALYLKGIGFDISFAPVAPNGIVDPSVIESLIKPTTKLISVMYVNNEIGTIQPIRKMAEIAHQHQIYFHTDAVQAFGKLPIDMKSQKIDLISLAGHKINGPKGIGALGCNPARFSDDQHIFRIQNYIQNLRDYLIEHVLKEIPDVQLNGDRQMRLYNNTNFSFQGLNGFDLMLLLDSNGIAVSTGSACSSKSQAPSRVLSALGLEPELAHGSIRMTLGNLTTQEDLDLVLQQLPKCVKQARYMYKQ
jgi:cysteine desulfurase